MQTTLQFSDAEIIDLFLQGDNQALETLILRHKDKIYTTIFMFVRDQYLAEDIFQDTFVKIINTIRDNRYNEQGKFLPWALRIAHNLCMDHFRKVSKNIPIVTRTGFELLELLPFACSDETSNLEQKQVHQSVRDLIEELPAEQREAVVLRIYGDLSFKEIADMSGISINTALGRMRYALLNLRKKIAERQMVLR